MKCYQNVNPQRSLLSVYQVSPVSQSYCMSFVDENISMIWKQWTLNSTCMEKLIDWLCRKLKINIEICTIYFLIMKISSLKHIICTYLNTFNSLMELKINFFKIFGSPEPSYDNQIHSPAFFYFISFQLERVQHQSERWRR